MAEEDLRPLCDDLAREARKRLADALATVFAFEIRLMERDAGNAGLVPLLSAIHTAAAYAPDPAHVEALRELANAVLWLGAVL